MVKCPVCERENETLICVQCGFDRSLDYEHYPTLCTASGVTVSARKET